VPGGLRFHERDAEVPLEGRQHRGRVGGPVGLVEERPEGRDARGVGVPRIQQEGDEGAGGGVGDAVGQRQERLVAVYQWREGRQLAALAGPLGVAVDR
jgi:hypothetical protein